MTKLNLYRTYKENCTIGELYIDDQYFCKTLELPNKGNKPNVSCVPAGIYPCEKYFSSKLGACIAVLEVDGRKYIRIHVGNFTYQIEGCILVGEKLLDFDGDGVTDVTNSKATMKRLFELLPDKFYLYIWDK